MSKDYPDTEVVFNLFGVPFWSGFEHECGKVEGSISYYADAWHYEVVGADAVIITHCPFCGEELKPTESVLTQRLTADEQERVVSALRNKMLSFCYHLADMLRKSAEADLRQEAWKASQEFADHYHTGVA